jgi:hypothetical protein
MIVYIKRTVFFIIAFVSNPFKYLMSMRNYILILLGLLIAPILFAQSSRWENITNTNMVTSLYNDGDTLWVGTFGGLVKYNKKTGESFCYNRANANLPTNSILDLSKDSKNNLWIAGRFNGIGCFKDETCMVFNRLNTDMIRDEFCRGIYIDKNDTVFVGSLKGCNIIFDNILKNTILGNFIISKPEYVNEIVPAPNGSLVLATTYGLYKYQKGVYSLLYNQTTDCNGVRFDNRGNLWVGTANNGLYKYCIDNSVLNYNSTNSDCPNNVSALQIDKNDDIWISGGLKLINFKESGNSEIYNMNLTKDQITTLSNDDTCIWIGTLQHGLYRFSNGQFRKVEIANQGLKSSGQLEMMNSNILLGGIQYNGNEFTILFDTLSGLKTIPFRGMKVLKDKGVFTFGDKTILGYYENGTWRYYDQFTNDYIKSIAAISPDSFWISTENRGLLKYENGNVNVYNSTNSLLPNNNLCALTFDNRGTLWGSFGLNSGIPGIFSFDGINWNAWTKTEVPYLAYPATDIKFDSRNNLWCNSINNTNIESSKGLIRFDGTNWSLYNTLNSLLPSNIIYRIFVDKTDTVWTAGVGGAAKFDGVNKWEAYTIYNSGMAFITAQNVVRLPNGDVYFTHTYGGISVLKNKITLENDSPSLLASADLKIYPIPARDMLTIQIPSNCTTYRIEMFDLSTKPIYSSAWNKPNQTDDTHTINTSSFPKGIYLLQLKTDKKIYLKKVIIR